MFVNIYVNVDMCDISMFVIVDVRITIFSHFIVPLCCVIGTRILVMVRRVVAGTAVPIPSVV